jgi:trk system potassium uptake protein TrkA
MYIIVVGAGRTGQRIVELTTTHQHEVVVIEKHEERAGHLSADHDCLVLHGDAASRDLLKEAGVGEADALIATTDEDTTNLMVMMLGRDLGAPHLISSVSDPDHIPLFEDLGVHRVESPHQLSGQQFYRAVVQPHVRDFMSLGNGAEIAEVVLEAGAPLVNRSLDELGEDTLPDDVILVAIERGDDLLVPKGDTTLQSGDVVTLFSLPGITDSLISSFEAD